MIIKLYGPPGTFPDLPWPLETSLEKVEKSFKNLVFLDPPTEEDPPWDLPWGRPPRGATGRIYGLSFRVAVSALRGAPPPVFIQGIAPGRLQRGSQGPGISTMP